MENTPTPPAPRTFCVWADCTRRVYQEVEATSPEEAHRLANDNPGGWQSCFGHESNGIRVSNDVQDAETDQHFTVGRAQHCKTCGSAIVETVNESAFREGECGPCEYVRYASARKSHETLRDLIDLAGSVAANWENGRSLADAVNNLARTAREAKTALNDAHGNAA